MIELAQILLDPVPDREGRLQALDRAALDSAARITTIRLVGGRIVEGDPPPRDLRQALAWSGSRVAHLYAGDRIPRGVARKITVPWVASGRTASSPIPWPRAPQPSRSLADEQGMPEAVDPSYFLPGREPDLPGVRVGLVRRSRSARELAEATRRRIERVREDVVWRAFDELPPAEALREVDVWFDPSVGDEPDGGVAEAMAAGRVVVASRTESNTVRLEQGGAGFLVRPGDPNELAHALLTALFKPELARPRAERARMAAERFRPARRAERLLEIYRSVLG